MAALWTMFSTRHMLVLSLALNLSLMLKIVQEKSKATDAHIQKLEQILTAEAPHNEAMQPMRFAIPQPHYSVVATEVAGDDGESAITLDQ